MSKKKKRALTDEQIQALAGDLLGTCDTLDEHLPDGVKFEALTFEDCSRLDDEVMRCEACSWWVESGYTNENGECDECVEDTDE